jgi:hypothetical protein
MVMILLMPTGRRLPAALLLALSLPLPGCGSDGSGAEATETNAPTTASAEAEEAPTAVPGALATIREDFALNFGGAGNPNYEVSWYTPPETLSITGTTLVARTDFYPDEEGEAFGRQLCNALNANYVLSNTANYGLDGVEVYGNDQTLASASGVGTC